MSTIILSFLGLSLAAGLAGFYFGWRAGYRFCEAEAAEEERMRDESRRFYEREKEKIKTEVFGNAKKRKDEIPGGGDSRKRFDSVNNSLRNKK